MSIIMVLIFGNGGKPLCMLADEGFPGRRRNPPPFHPLGPRDHETPTADGAVLSFSTRVRASSCWCAAAAAIEGRQFPACLFEMPGPLQ